MSLTEETVKEIIDECRDNDDININCACSLLNLLEIINCNIDKFSETYTTSIIKNNITEEMDKFNIHMIKSIEEEFVHLYSLITIIKQMRPEGGFDIVDARYQHIYGKYEMFKNIVDCINNTNSTVGSDNTAIDIII